MPFLDFDHSAASEFTADVCILGTGAVGIALAMEFLNSSTQVLLVESGQTQFEAEVQQLYDSDVSGLPFPGVHEGRVRIHGGTTTKWAGQASRWDPFDFEARPWVAESGWPITRDDLMPYYQRAEQRMGLEPRNYDASDWPGHPSAAVSYDPACLKFCYSQFAAQPNFAVRHREQFRSAENVRVLLHANAVSIATDAQSQQVDHIDLQSLAGKSGQVRARHYIVCLGGIETARLLLASRQHDPAGIGNRHDLVGRFFQDHIHGLVARIHPHDRRAFHLKFDPIYSGRFKIHPKVAMAPTLQRKQQTLHVAGDIVYEQSPDSPIEAAKLILRSVRQPELRSQLPRALLRVLRRPHELVAAAWRYGVSGQTVTPKNGPIYLGIQSETQPNRESRVRLGSRLDALGMPRCLIEWKLTDLELKSIDLFIRTVQTEFDRLGVARVDYDPDLLAGFPQDIGKCHDASHHMGTTRMAHDPQQGVVNADCQVHGIENLHIGGSSVFPTSSFSNPTLTALALCIRLSERLKSLL